MVQMTIAMIYGDFQVKQIVISVSVSADLVLEYALLLMNFEK